MKVVDFGLTLADQLSYDEEFSLSMIFGHDCLGTCDYMAPEQAIDSLHVDARADVYGLGCTLFAILAARRVYNLPTAAAVIEAHRSQPVPKLIDIIPTIPKALSDFVARMMAKNPADRPPTCRKWSTHSPRSPSGSRFRSITQISSMNAARRPNNAGCRFHSLAPCRHAAPPQLGFPRPSTRVPRESITPNRNAETPSLKQVPGNISQPEPCPASAKRHHVPEEHRLLLVFEDGEQLLIRHTESLIGRANDCQIQLNDPEIALHHCRLEFDGEKWILTSVGGVPLQSNGESKKTTLPRIGDRIELSKNTKFVIKRPRMNLPVGSGWRSGWQESQLRPVWPGCCFGRS